MSRRSRVLGLATLALSTSVVPATEAPRRVVSLNLTADELLVEMLPPGRLVAVTRWADDADMSNVAGRVPAMATRLPRADLERPTARARSTMAVRIPARLSRPLIR